MVTRRVITDSNGFRAMAALRKAALDPRIEEIEGGGADEGRVFIHAKPGWRFTRYDTISASAGSAAELRTVLAMLKADGRSE